MKILHPITLCTVLVLLCSSCSAAKEPNNVLASYSRNREQLLLRSARQKSLPVSKACLEIIREGHKKDWSDISALYSEIESAGDGTDGAAVPPELVPLVAEAYWTYRLFHNWDKSLLQEYAESILASLPNEKAVFLSGTDAGRYGITAFSVSERVPVIVISPNQIADEMYQSYIKMLYKEQLWLPGDQSRSDVRQRLHARSLPHLQAQDLVWEASKELTRQVFDNNRNDYTFFVDEGYEIEWMYPYLKPCGLIMEVNPSPLTALPSQAIEKDTVFWSDKQNSLLSSRRFRECIPARAAYAKLRCAIGGLYLYHELYPEAEQALKQALLLYQDSRDAIFRLWHLYLVTERYAYADALLETYAAAHPHDPQLPHLKRKPELMRKLFARQKDIERDLPKGTMDLNKALELADIYRQLGKSRDFRELVEAIASRKTIPPGAFQSLAEICAAGNRLDVLKAVCRKNLDETNGEMHLRLATVYLTDGRVGETITILGQALDIDKRLKGRTLAEDIRFRKLQGNRTFQALLKKCSSGQ